MSIVPDSAMVSHWGTFLLPILFDATIKGTVILIAAWLASILMARRSAAWRYGVWFLALATLPMLPLLKVALPQWRVLPPPPQTLVTDIQSIRQASTPTPTSESPFKRFSQAPFAPLQASPRADENQPLDGSVSTPALPVATALRVTNQSNTSAAHKARPLTAGCWIVISWASGCAVLVCDALLGALLLRRLRRRAAGVSDPALLELAASLCDRLSIRRRVELFHSPGVMPMTWGVFRSVILLPCEAIGWSSSRSRAVLLHELGHIKRHDCLAGWWVRLVSALYWFHPLVWLASKRLTAERESACDDLVLRYGESAPVYAEHLLQVASAGSKGIFTARTAVAMARRGRLDLRIRAILQDQLSRRALGRRALCTLLLVLAVIVVPLAMLATSHPAHAQTAATQPASSQPSVVPGQKYFTFRTIDQTGNPVPHADLFLVQDSYRFPIVQPGDDFATAVTKTDANGIANVTLPAGVKVNVMAWITGYAPVFIRGASLNPDKPFEIRFDPGQMVVGSLTSADGAPVAGAQLHAIRKNFPIDYMEQYALAGSSDASGHFKLDHAAAGDYVLTAVIQKDDPATCFTPVEFTVDINRAPPPLKMSAQPGAVFKGKMINAYGVRTSNREIFVSVRLPTPSQQRLKTADDGSFTIRGIPAESKGGIYFGDIGEYKTEVEWQPIPPSCKLDLGSLNFDHVPPGLYDGIEVHLYKPATVTGTVTDEKGNPFEKLAVIVQPSNRLFYTDKNGKYKAVIPPKVDANLELKYGFDKQTFPIHLDEEQSAERNVVFTRKVEIPHVSEMTGRVVDENGTPVKAAEVSLGNNAILPMELLNHDRNSKSNLTWSDPTFAPAHLMTDAQGQFRFNELHDGKTDVWAEAADSRWGWLRDVNTNSKTIELKLQKASIERPVFSGTVVDDQGQPVANAKVCLSNRGRTADEVLTTTSTDSQGRFSLKPELPHDPPKQWVYLVARSPSGRCTWKVAPLFGGSDIALRFKAEATVHGRLTNNKGTPLPGAPVWLYLGQDPDQGDIFFYNKMLDIAPKTTTAEDGSFTLRGLPVGSTVSISAKHPKYQPATTWYVANIQPGTEIKEMTAEDGITIAGTVRMAGSNQPVAGATVDLVTSGEPLATVLSDAQGRYRFVGVDRWWVMEKFAVAVHVGQPAELEGSTRCPLQLFAGDEKTDLDISISQSFTARQAEWLRRKGTASPGTNRVAVVDAINPQSTHLNTLEIFDGSGTIVGSHDGLDFHDSWDCDLTVNPTDHASYLYNRTTGQLSKFSPDAKLLWQRQMDKYLGNFAIDPESGNLWTTKPNGTLYTDTVTVYSPEGEQLHEWKIKGSALIYSPHDHCFWISGQKLLKVGLDGKVLLEAPVAFTWLADTLAVNPTDGSVWVGERAHPDERQSMNRLFIIASDGQVRRQIDLGDNSPGRIELDPSRSTAWMLRGHDLARLSMDGQVQSLIPVTGDICMEPDTGCVWIAGPAGIIRIDPAGDPVLIRQSTSARKRICLVGP